MPINDPIKGKKVAPASLAFESGRAARGGLSVTYQGAVNATTQVLDGTGYIKENTLSRTMQDAQLAVMAAEIRAKNWVAEYMNVFEWDISDDLTVTTDTWDVVGFDQPVLKCIGAEFTGTISAADARFYFKCVKGYQGIWWFFTKMFMVFTAGMQITVAKIGFYKNGSLYRVVDAMDAGMSGESFAFIGDCVIGDGCHIPVDVGDEIEVRIYLDSDLGSGDQLLLAPTSVYGFVTAHRERCDTSFTGSAPVTGDEFEFTT